MITYDEKKHRMTVGDPDIHLGAVARFLSEAFAGGQHIDAIAMKYLRESHYDWGTSRLIWDDEVLIHHWGVWGYPMRLESIYLNTAGVGAVATREAYRKQGLMHRAAQASFLAMRENGYDISVLRGRHYAKYGYVRAWNYVTYRIKAEDLPDSEHVPEYRRLGPAHLDAINQRYNESHAGLSGTAVRPTYPMLDEDDMQVYGWFDSEGVLQGCVRAALEEGNAASLQCLEASGDAQMGLDVLADLTSKLSCNELTLFTFHHDHPLAQLARRGACLIEDHYFRHSGWQVRVIHLARCLRKMIPLLETRLAHSGLAGWKGHLLLDSGSEQAGLAINAASVAPVDAPVGDHALLAGFAMARLLIGSDEPEEILRQAGAVCAGDGAALAQVLFPNTHPMLSHWDEY
ncbi:MAG: GNAT family N-acetyltransferase [Anaerolineales bacterium]|nr:GNAT family N-acetyltransferase [Anaerolineales bacterium]